MSHTCDWDCDCICDHCRDSRDRQGIPQPEPPQRIQLRRTTGWRKPEGAIVVSRPSRWGNPYVAEDEMVIDAKSNRAWSCPSARDAREFAVKRFRSWALACGPEWLEPLAGHDLACWCPLDEPCHADVLLELANG